MKKIISIFLVFCLSLLPLCGCSDTGSDVQSENVIHIGIITNLDGRSGDWDSAVLAGMQIAVTQINERSDDSLKIELHSIDIGSDPDEVTEAYQDLKKEGMQILASGASGDICKGAATLAREDGMTIVSASGVAGVKAIHMLASPVDQGTAVAQLISEKWRDASVGLVYDAGDDYSAAIADAFSAEAKKLGVHATFADFSDEESNDLSASLRLCQAQGCNLLFIPADYRETASILTASAELDYFPMFITGDRADGLLALEDFDQNLAEGLVLVKSARNMENSAYSSFVDAYQLKTDGQKPSPHAVAGYDMINAIYRACIAGKVNGDTSPSDAYSALSGAFSQMTFDGLTEKGLQWDQHGYLSKTFDTVVIDDGKYISLNTDR